MCRIDYADDDGGMWREEPHEATARKSHVCGDCGRPIDAGERYTRAVWLQPGDGFIPVSMCQQCVAAGKWLRKVCGGHFWPGVLEELREHWDEEFELRSVGLGRLLLVGGRKWQRRGALVSVADVERWADEAIARVPAGGDALMTPLAPRSAGAQ